MKELNEGILFSQCFLIISIYTAGFTVNGRITSPEIINLTPAKWNGVSYCNPILMPAYAVDHSRQAIIAQKVVFPLLIIKNNQASNIRKISF